MVGAARKNLAKIQFSCFSINDLNSERRELKMMNFKELSDTLWSLHNLLYLQSTYILIRDVN